MRECNRCPETNGAILRCAHFGDMTIALIEQERLAAIPCPVGHRTGTSRYLIGGPIREFYSLDPDLRACEHGYTWGVRPMNAPSWSDSLEAAEAEFARREALLLAQEVEA